MKKHLNVDLIQSELRGGSAFFPGYKGRSAPALPKEAPKQQRIRQPTPEEKRGPVDPTTPTALPQDKEKPSEVRSPSQGVPPPGPRTGPRTDPRTNTLIPKVKRQIKQRQPFDIYEDQYTSLKQIADAERSFINGRSMSKMVRDAIDAYLIASSPSNKK